MNDNAATPVTPTLSGKCLCGAVRFVIRAISDAVMCHCAQCRKAQGAAFACNLPVAASDFRYKSGQSIVQEFKSSPSKTRVFCSNCGSPIFSKRKGSGTLRIRTGTLDGNPKFNVVAHIFCESAANWAPILDNLPKYDEFEPERSL